MGWDYEKIAEERIEQVTTFLASASQDDIKKRLLDLESSLYAMTYTLNGLEMKDAPPRHAVTIQCGLIPFLDEQGDAIRVEKVNGKFEPVKINDPKIGDKFELADSLPICGGTEIPDSFTIISGGEHITGGYCYHGSITMEDVRRAWSLLYPKGGDAN